MYTRHQEIPVLSAWPSKVSAQRYGLVRRALGRTPPTIRISLRGLKTLDMILQRDAWILIDRSLNDLPVAAWVDFDDTDDRALHQDVMCELRYYHGHAGIVTARALRRLDEDLVTRLADSGTPHDDGSTVITLPLPHGAR